MQSKTMALVSHRKQSYKAQTGLNSVHPRASNWTHRYLLTVEVL